MTRQKILLAILSVAMLSFTRCSSIDLPKATVIPTQTVWKISYPSELAWMVDDFEDCLDNTWNTGVVVEETQNLQLQGSQADVLLVWGDVDPQGLDAWLLGMDQWVLVTNAGLALQEVSAEELVSIYAGNVRNWNQIDAHLSGEIHGWIYPEDLSIFRQFATSLGGIARLSPYLGVAPDVRAMIEAVSSDPLAIGILPASWPKHGLKIITVNGIEGQTVPVVALTKDEKDEKLTAWLACLDGKLP